PIEIAQRFRTRDIEVMRRNTAFQENEHLLLADGRRKLLMALHFPQLDEQGTLFAVGTLLTDITGYHLCCPMKTSDLLTNDSARLLAPRVLKISITCSKSVPRQ
ncbi:MAG: hypothetical protein IPJ38_15460, partial [Dechloromonas sp.]|nr:hypothetical protein [Candidatus Dechloromonas phosphorivorans]